MAIPEIVTPAHWSRTAAAGVAPHLLVNIRQRTSCQPGTQSQLYWESNR